MCPVLRTLCWLLVPTAPLLAQVQDDQGDTITNVYQLGELVVRGRADGLDLEGFMRQVMEDTTFQHAFLNTRYHAHQVKSSFRVRHKGDQARASMYREGHLHRDGDRATLVLDQVEEQGKLRDAKGRFRYLTAELYHDVFFPEGTWHADNSIRAHQDRSRPQGRVQKYKSELKQFMFSPGQDIASVPLVGHKLGIYDADMAGLYDHTIGSAVRQGRPCWRFMSRAKEEGANSTAIKSMVTWFDQSTMEVLAREYHLRQSNLLLDFDIRVQVENVRSNGDLVPISVVYDGDWDIPLRKRELVRFELHYSDWVVP